MADQQYQSYAEPLADGPYLPAWQPQVVDQVPRRRTLPVALIAATAFVSIVEPITGSTSARAAAIIGGNDVTRRAPIVQYVQLVGPVVVPGVAQPAPELSWDPEYPDFARGRVGLRTGGQQAYAAAVSPSTEPELRWQPIYPERVRPQVSLRTAAQQAFAFYHTPIVGAVAPPELSWEGSYPAQAPQIPGPVAVRAYLFAFVDTEPVIIIQPIADLRWRPSTPDLLSRPTVTPDQQQAFAFYPVPIAAPVVTALSWAPEHPDLLARRVYRASLQQPYAGPIDPIAATALVPLSWAPVYPDRLARIAQRIAAGATLPPEDIAIVMTLGWLPSYPDFHARVVPSLAPGVLPLQIPTSVIANAVSCVHLSQITVTQAALVVQGVTQATVLTEIIRDESPLTVQVC